VPVAHIPLVVQMGISWSCWMATSSLCTVQVVATGSTAFGLKCRIVEDTVPATGSCVRFVHPFMDDRLC